MRRYKGMLCVDISEFESYMPSHAVGLCALCQVPALTAFALAARPARLPADEAAPDIDINSDEEKIVRVQAGTSTATPDRAAPPLRGRETND